MTNGNLAATIIISTILLCITILMVASRVLNTINDRKHDTHELRCIVKCLHEDANSDMQEPRRRFIMRHHAEQLNAYVEKIY